jgi:plastocyanin
MLKGKRNEYRGSLLLLSGMLVAGLLAACGGSSSTAPGNGAGNGAGNGGNTHVGAAPPTAAVTVGDIFYKSVNNGSSNKAVDTVAVGGTVTWTWAPNESLPHGVQSTGSPSFASSAIQSGAGRTYQVTFTVPGSYQYDCAVHGTAMTGTIVVLSPPAGATAPAYP